MRPRGAVPVVVAITLCGCSSIGDHRRVDAAEFQRLAGLPTGTLQHTWFIGADEKFAYLGDWRYGSLLLGGGTHICSVELDALPAPLAEQLRAGVNPWRK